MNWLQKILHFLFVRPHELLAEFDRRNREERIALDLEHKTELRIMGDKHNMFWSDQHNEWRVKPGRKFKL